MKTIPDLLADELAQFDPSMPIRHNGRAAHYNERRDSWTTFRNGRLFKVMTDPEKVLKFLLAED